MNGRSRRKVFYRKPNGEIGVRELHPSALMARKSTITEVADRRAASVLKGSKLEISTWWFGEPEIQHSSDSKHELADKSPFFALKDY